MNKFLACLAVVFMSLNAYALPPTPQSVEKLLTEIDKKSVIDTLHISTKLSIEQLIKEQCVSIVPLSTSGQRLMDEFPEKYISDMREEYSWEKIKPSYMKIYTETFSQDEIYGLIDFFSSPVGKSYLKKMPEADMKLMAPFAEMMQDYYPKMKAAVIKTLDDAKQRK